MTRELARGSTPIFTSGGSLLSATLAIDGLTLTLVFEAAVDIGDDQTGFSVRGQAPANASVSATYLSGDGTDTIILELASEFYATETTKLAYVQPGDGFGDGVDFFSSFVNFTVTNNSEVGDGILRDGNGRPVPDGNGRAIPILES